MNKVIGVALRGLVTAICLLLAVVLTSNLSGTQEPDLWNVVRGVMVATMAECLWQWRNNNSAKN